MLITAALILGLAGEVAIQEPPTRPVITVTDSEPAPPTLEELWQRADAVVRARIVAVQTHELVGAAGYPGRPITQHSAVVIEALKGSVNTGETISVSVPVGTLETPTGRHEARASGMTTFDVGEEVLLFLVSWPAADGYAVAYGPVGFYQLDRDDVAIPSAARGWAAFKNRTSLPKGTFLAAIRKLENLPAK